MLTPVAVKFTLVPEQTEVADDAMETEGSKEPEAVIVMPGLAVAVPRIHPIPEPPGVNTMLTKSLFAGT